eukprot:1139485-Pelagomonas_calceolata.AAC.14
MHRCLTGVLIAIPSRKAWKKTCKECERVRVKKRAGANPASTGALTSLPAQACHARRCHAQTLLCTRPVTQNGSKARHALRL